MVRSISLSISGALSSVRLDCLADLSFVRRIDGICSRTAGTLERCFEGVSIHDSQQPGDVYVAYHSYRGFLVWFVQQEHQFYATPEDAKQVIAKLLQFNLTWGLLSYGALFIPFLAVGNYYAQLKSIQNQQA